LSACQEKLPEVDIVILNWNGWPDTIECLASLNEIDYSNTRIIIVDNNSSDDSVKEIMKYAEEKLKVGAPSLIDLEKRPPLTVSSSRREIENDRKRQVSNHRTAERFLIIENKENLGFAEGNNVAIRYALKNYCADYILLLNNDVVVDRDFLKELVRIAGSSAEIGIVGSTIYYYDMPDVINFAGEDITLWKAKGTRYTNHVAFPQQVDKVDGACMLIKRDVFEKVGLLDNDFFVYWEETDFCQRAKKKGYKVVYVPTSKIWHKIARSIGGLGSHNRLFYLSRNRFLFVKKNVRGFERIMFLAYFFGLDIWLSIGMFLKSRNLKALAPFITGSFDGLGLLMRV
jgi:hypothetical protein